MSQYADDIQAAAGLIASQGSAWDAIDPESVARMKAQNRFRTGLDIARYTAKIMREDMARYDADRSPQFVAKAAEIAGDIASDFTANFAVSESARMGAEG